MDGKWRIIYLYQIGRKFAEIGRRGWYKRRNVARFLSAFLLTEVIMPNALFALAFVGRESEWFWLMCQFVAVSATLLFILRQVKLQKDTHLVNSFAIFGQRWESQMMLKARKEVCTRHKPDNHVVDATMHQLCLFFEEMGVFCSRKVLNLDIIWEIYSFEIEHYWPITKNSIISFRKNQGDNSFYFHFERLHEQIRKLSGKKGAPVHERTHEEINQFVQVELDKVHFFVEHAEDRIEPPVAPKTPQEAKSDHARSRTPH